MLMQIIYQFEEFHCAHGKLPNVLYLNPEHHAALIDSYPELIGGSKADEITSLGLKIVVVPADLMRYPRVACVLPGISQIFHCEDRSGSGDRYRSRVAPQFSQRHFHGKGSMLRHRPR